ncbi:MAG: SAM-dependent methyltransferase [Lachnospiraceae bacterium]|nr:SAM-dependent methyltransferase [Lachnospiraceae bacterium]
MELSKRLQTIADMVTPGLTVADVGCDHGFVSIYLYEKQIAKKVIAMDLRPGPLARAKEHIEAFGYVEYIETRLSDGVTALAVGEAEAVICAGMGGRLMAKILSDGYEKVIAMKELVLQPQSELQFFRAFLRENNLHIIEEDMVKEDGKYYPILKVVPGAGQREKDKDLQRIEDCFGPCLTAQKHPVLKEFLEMLLERNRDILERIKKSDAQNGESRNALRIQTLEEEIKDIVYCLSLYNGRNTI